MTRGQLTVSATRAFVDQREVNRVITTILEGIKTTGAWKVSFVSAMSMGRKTLYKLEDSTGRNKSLILTVKTNLNDSKGFKVRLLPPPDLDVGTLYDALRARENSPQKEVPPEAPAINIEEAVANVATTEPEPARPPKLSANDWSQDSLLEALMVCLACADEKYQFRRTAALTRIRQDLKYSTKESTNLAIAMRKRSYIDEVERNSNGKAIEVYQLTQAGISALSVAGLMDTPKVAIRPAATIRRAEIVEQLERIRKLGEPAPPRASIINGNSLSIMLDDLSAMLALITKKVDTVRQIVNTVEQAPAPKPKRKTTRKATK